MQLRPVPEVVRELGSLPMKQRRYRLQKLIGHPSTDKAELEWRAQLVTAVREQGLWPAG